MSIAERKAREKDDLRSLILDQARKLFVEKGIEQTTIRSIAEAIDYSVGTVYVYFRSKDAILYALHSQGFRMLGSQFSVLTSVSDPMQRLQAMGRIYIRFAQENRDMYDLMFGVKAPMQYLDAANETEWDEGNTTFDALSSTVAQCMASGYFKGHTLEPLTFLIWSTVHGMCSLEISCRTKVVSAGDPASIVDRAFDEFLLILDKL